MICVHICYGFGCIHYLIGVNCNMCEVKCGVDSYDLLILFFSDLSLLQLMSLTRSVWMKWYDSGKRLITRCRSLLRMLNSESVAACSANDTVNIAEIEYRSVFFSRGIGQNNTWDVHLHTKHSRTKSRKANNLRTNKCTYTETKMFCIEMTKHKFTCSFREKKKNQNAMIFRRRRNFSFDFWFFIDFSTVFM